MVIIWNGGKILHFLPRKQFQFFLYTPNTERTTQSGSNTKDSPVEEKITRKMPFIAFYQ